MENWVVPVICVSVMLVLIIIQLIMRSKHPIRSAFLSLLPGIIALACVNLTAAFTSVTVPVSPLTLAVSAVLGIPGVIGLLVIQRIL